MIVLYKENWKEAKDKLRVWWEEGEGVLIQVIAPRNKFKGKWYGWDTWMFMKVRDKFEVIVREFERWCETTYFGGEAFPNLWINFGPGILGAFLGATPKFTGDTVWFGACWNPSLARNLDELLEGLDIDPSNEWWIRVKKATEVVGRLGRGRFIVGMTDIGGVVDVLASLRGSTHLIKDMIIRPNDVEKVIWNIFELWHQCYDKLYSLIPQEGTSAWMGIWCHKRWYPIQCDFAAMLSPKLFRRFVLPHIAEHCRLLDFTIYHLDGPGELPHVDMLLNIEELDGIQWVPGAGMENRGYHCGSPIWLPLYRKILQKGKRLVISVPLGSIDLLLKRLPPKGILIQTYCNSEKEAREIVEKYEK